MFQSARIKLTAWYLLIIMLVSVLFSIGIYRVLDNELGRFALAQQRRFERQRLFLGYPLPTPTQRLYAPELLEESKDRLKLVLLLLNGGILLVSGGASYFLAGRTLKPIEQMVEAQKQFTADASHELRTPLTAMKSETEVALRDKKLTVAQARSQLQSNLEEINKLQALTDYLLTLSRYQYHAMPLHVTQVDVGLLIASVTKKVSVIAQARHIIINTTVNKLTIEADQKSLNELLTILLENAIKFSHDKGTIAVAAKREGQSAVMSITDNGPGISQHEIAHIFKRFYQSDKSRSSDKGGYGLGLAIAKKIVEVHHGTIDVKSTPNVQTRFTIKLPLKQPATSQA